MSKPRIYDHEVWEGQDWQPEDLFAYGDGTLPLHSEIDDIDVHVFKLPEATAVLSVTGISPGNGVSGPFYNTPQLDAGWRQGPPGYNSKIVDELTATAREAAFTEEPEQSYRVEISLNGTPQGRLLSVHRYKIKGRYSQP